jgi:SH3-like domain-containing protein
LLRCEGLQSGVPGSYSGRIASGWQGTGFVTAFRSCFGRLLLALVVLGTAAVAAAAQDAAPTPQDAPSPPAQAPAREIGPSGLPLPRFASLASSEVNARTGPSTDHPIRWVYERADLPVKIVEEFDVWRRIEDADGETGWAHASLLSLRRTVLVRGQGIQELRRSPEADARVVARAEPGVIGELVECQPGWCRIEVGGERGWLPKPSLWGVEADE